MAAIADSHWLFFTMVFDDFFTIKVFDHNNELFLQLKYLIIIIQIIAVKCCFFLQLI